MVIDKRGNILDWFYIIPILMIICITVFACWVIVDKVDESGAFSDTADAQTAISQTKATLLSFDHLLLFIIVGLSLYVLISGAMVYNHPGFFFIGVFLLFIAIVISASISNAFWTFSNSATVLTTSSLYPKITFLMNNLPFYICFMGVATMAVMYTSYRREG